METIDIRKKFAEEEGLIYQNNDDCLYTKYERWLEEKYIELKKDYDDLEVMYNVAEDTIQYGE